ncbi:MAG: zinc ABC transporter substrate-binding protein [Clostridiales bacterium]|nr:zinc ABC transporter substrate-binding protein [Clostridiales bacterium]
MRKKVLVSILAFLFLLTVFSAAAVAQDANAAVTVAVGIVPEATFVKAVAGDLADIVTLVPPGNSPANYQPTATEMQQLSDAAVYFTLQMPTEQANILPKVSDFNADVKIVDLREAVAAVYPLLNMGEENDYDEDHDFGHDADHEEDHNEDNEDGNEGHEYTGVDPHVWLSPKRAIVMVQTIAEELSAIDPANRETYRANAAAYIAKLEALDSYIQEKTEVMPNKSFIIYHAAYGYFADDYGLTMVAIEIEGKQATAAELQQVIDYAREQGISTVFYQAEFDDNQAATVAEEIGGTVAQAAPLSPDYILSLEEFADALAQSGN